MEGYIDVIAMVSAGYEATVAPLGTALTPEQMALLWKMTDEPVLCFDGDSAGRRAAYRAVDTALPLLKPGKSLTFAALPEGEDPDDLLRAAGRAAVDEVLAGARPLAQMLWLRETETGQFETPERRAALEARLGEVLGTVGEESVRKYYRQDFSDRLRRLFDRGAGIAAPPLERRAGRSWQGANRSRRPGALAARAASTAIGRRNRSFRASATKC